MNEETKAIIIALAFLILFLIVPIEWHGNGGDHDFHWKKAAYACTTSACKSYPPLFHWLAGFFIARTELFIFFVLFLFAVVTPLLLFKITGNAVAVWFYFSTTSYFYYVEAGPYPHGLAMILLLGLFATKNNLIRLAILGLSIITHSASFYLITFAFLVILLKENYTKIGGVVAFCSPFWGKERPEIVTTYINNANVYLPTAVSINSLLSLIIKVCPLPFLYWGIRGLIAKRHWDFLLVAAVAFVAAFFTTERLFQTIPLMIIPGLVWYYEKCKFKKLILFLSVLWCAFLLEQWFAMATYIFC